uniref:Uncharacterized protein n=1 Tax=Fagus sylvatica TaxID=28930 RepID=A0A2N9G7C8_FAGSY
MLMISLRPHASRSHRRLDSPSLSCSQVLRHLDLPTLSPPILQFWLLVLNLSGPATTWQPILEPAHPSTQPRSHSTPTSSLSLSLSNFVQMLVY